MNLRPLSIALISLSLVACGPVDPRSDSGVGDAGGGAGGGEGGGAGGGAAGGGGSGTGGGLTLEQQQLLAARPYAMQVPSGTDGGPLPLVVLLHGYGSWGTLHNLYFGFWALAESKKFLLAAPDGTVDRGGKRFWDATDVCCNFTGSPVDDVKYLTAILDDAALRHRVDPRRVYFVGHSNGGFMSHRMACDRSERIAAIVSLAGTTWNSIDRCHPTQPLSVLQVHGTADDIVSFDGGTFPSGPYPGARDTVDGWATLNQCTGPLVAGAGPLDLDSAVAGAETRRSAYSCSQGAAELWTMQGTNHAPSLNANWGAEVWNFLAAHPKPAALSQ